MEYYKTEVVEVLKAMIEATIESIHVYLDYLKQDDHSDAIKEQIYSQLIAHIRVLHHSFRKNLMSRLFIRQHLDSIIEPNLLMELEQIYIDALKDELVKYCECEWCIDFTS